MGDGLDVVDAAVRFGAICACEGSWLSRGGCSCSEGVIEDSVVDVVVALCDTVSAKRDAGHGMLKCVFGIDAAMTEFACSVRLEARWEEAEAILAS